MLNSLVFILIKVLKGVRQDISTGILIENTAEEKHVFSSKHISEVDHIEPVVQGDFFLSPHKLIGNENLNYVYLSKSSWVKLYN